MRLSLGLGPTALWGTLLLLLLLLLLLAHQQYQTEHQHCTCWLLQRRLPITGVVVAEWGGLWRQGYY